LYIGWDWFLNEVEINGCSNYPSGSLGHIGPVVADTFQGPLFPSKPKTVPVE
jgi:hypothetical protein